MVLAGEMDIKLLRYVESKPIVRLATVKAVLGASNMYASLVLARLVHRGILRKVMRNKYTAQDNVHLIATNLFSPSYLSLWGASSYLGYTEQMPTVISVITSCRRKDILFEGYTFRFVVVPQRYFFGYTKIVAEQGTLFIAEDEKLVIDAVHLQQEMGNADEIIKIVQKARLDAKKMVLYLNRIGNTSLWRRVGYLLEVYKGIDLYSSFSGKDRNYVRLFLSRKKLGKRNAKWGVIV